MIILCMKMGLLLISAFGYWEYFRSKWGIQACFSPVFTISVQFSVLLAAGLLNCLGEAALLLHGIGIALFAWAVYKQKLRVFLPYLNVGYLFFGLAFCLVGLTVRDQQFTQIDNFTHWATVVRNMLSTDRFPTFRETAIEFTTYPLGSSAMIYFFCKLAGEGEDIQMLAQAYCMLSALLPVFAFCQKNKGAFFALVTVMTGFLLHYNIPVTELLVDTLMPLSGMAAVFFVCFHYRDQDHEPGPSMYCVIPLLIWAMNIKHAALIFSVFALVLLYLCVRKRKQGRKQWLLSAGAVFLARILWSRHCDYVFEGADTSKHSMSLGWFQSVLGDKSQEGILDTAKMVLEHLTTRTEILWLGAWILLLGLLVWFWIPEEKKRYLTFLIGGISLYAVYAIGIMGMYVFSMEDYGQLLAFTRYMRSIDIALYYMLTVLSGLILTRLIKTQWVLLLSAVLIVLTAAGWHWQTGKYLKEKLACCPVEWRQELEQPIADYGIEPGKRCLLLVNENHHGWPRRIWRYRLETGAVDQQIVTDPAQLENAGAYDYVVILDTENPVVEAWVQENYPDAAGSSVIVHDA